MPMKRTLLPILVVLAAILSLLLYPNFKGEKSMNQTSTDNPIVVIETTMGTITV